MANPIKDTPILTGKAALNFEAWMKANEGKKVSAEAHSRIKSAAKKFKFANA